MQTEARKKAATTIGVVSGIIGILAFFGWGTYDAIKKSFSNSSDGKNLDSVSAKPNTYSGVHPAVLPTTDSISNKKNQIRGNDNLKMVAENSQDKGQEKSNADYEILDFNKESKEQFNTEDEVTIGPYITPSEEGYGKLAVRVFCNHCYHSYTNIRILNDDSTLVDDGAVRANYNPEHKFSSTYIKDLPYGKYILELNFFALGKNYININVVDGKISLYKFKKINPFGDKNGQIVFFSVQKSEKWRIFIDRKEMGVYTLFANKGTSIILPFGNHEYTAERVVPSQLYDDKNQFTLYLHQGQRLTVRL
jgi:hypothetical protein